MGILPGFPVGGRRARQVGIVADVLSVLNMLGNLLVSLFGWDRSWLGWSLFIGCALWLMCSLLLRLWTNQRVKSRRVFQPEVVLLGGSADREFMEAIRSAPALNTNPFIVFSTWIVDDGIDRNKLKNAMGANSIVLMPSVTASSQPVLISELTKLSPQTLPIVRCYPEGYFGERPRDFSEIPFHTPDTIVSYASEFLLGRAEQRSRVIESRYQLAKWALWVLTPYMALSLFVGSIKFRELQLLQRRDTIPPTLLQSIAEVLDRSRSLRQQEPQPVDPGQLHGLNAIWSDVILADITYISGNSEPKVLSVHAASADNKRLIPVVIGGAKAYELDAAGSIAGCAYQRRIAVYWSGHQDRTTKILAWGPNGELVGSYDSTEQRLDIPGSAPCRYQIGKNEPRRQLLCVPVGAGAGIESVPLVACLSLDGDADFVQQPWLRNVLISMSIPLAVWNAAPLAMKQPPDL